jgi:hypothetical protein
MKLRNLILTGTLVAAPLAAFAQTATVSRTDLTSSGQNITTGLQNQSGNIYFQNDGYTFVVIRNGNGTAVTATALTQKTSVQKPGFGTITLSDQSISIPSASTVLVGPFPTGRWNLSSGLGRISMSTVTGISATGLRLKGNE